MSLGNWDPTPAQGQQPFKADAERLQRFIALSQNDLLADLSKQLSSDEQQTQANLMQLDQKAWAVLAQALNDDDIEQLMRFFTMAETLPGWEAGANSPVIWLGKELKKRGTGINRDLTIWIKANSDNRYIPHGALL